MKQIEAKSGYKNGYDKRTMGLCPWSRHNSPSAIIESRKLIWFIIYFHLFRDIIIKFVTLEKVPVHGMRFQGDLLSLRHGAKRNYIFIKLIDLRLLRNSIITFTIFHRMKRIEFVDRQCCEIRNCNEYVFAECRRSPFCAAGRIWIGLNEPTTTKIRYSKCSKS